MTDYQQLLMDRARGATRAAVEKVLADAPPYGSLEDLFAEALHAGCAAAADVWGDAMLYGADALREPSFKDWPAPTALDGRVTVAGGLVVRPADYRSAPDYRPAR